MQLLWVNTLVNRLGSQEQSKRGRGKAGFQASTHVRYKHQTWEDQPPRKRALNTPCQCPQCHRTPPGIGSPAVCPHTPSLNVGGPNCLFIEPASIRSPEFSWTFYPRRAKLQGGENLQGNPHCFRTQCLRIVNFCLWQKEKSLSKAEAHGSDNRASIFRK